MENFIKYSSQVAKEFGNIMTLCIKLNRPDFQIVCEFCGYVQDFSVRWYDRSSPETETRNDIFFGGFYLKDDDKERLELLRKIRSDIIEASKNHYFKQNPENSITDYVKDVIGGEIR